MLIDQTKFKYPLFNVPLNKDFRDLLEFNIKNYGDKISFLEKDENNNYKGITFKEFYNLVKYLGQALFEIGLKERDKVGLIGKNCRNWAISYLGITTSNMIVIPIDKELKPMEIENICRRAGIKAIIFENKFKEIFTEIKKKLNFIKFLIPFEKENDLKYSLKNLINIGKNIYETKKLENIKYENIKINPEEVTAILFTSGTTGNPKGVMLSQKNILTNINQMRQLHHIDQNDVFLSFLPLHHSYECTCGFLCPIQAGSTIAYAQSLKKIPENIAEAKATMLLAVPALLEVFYKRIKEAAFSGLKGRILFSITTGICDVWEFLTGKNIRKKIFKKLHDKFGGNLKTFISGGAALKPEIAKFFTKLGFITVQGYGITECSPLLAVNRVDENRKLIETKFESVGKPAPGIDIVILNENESNVGEIAVKGPNVMLGYYEEPDLTEKAFYNGYFLTGDYGYIDKDNFLYISGRKKDIIITENGKNVYPEEIESLYINNEEISEIVVKEWKDPEKNTKTIIAIIFPDFEYLSKKLSKTEDQLKNSHNLLINIFKEIIKENNKKLSNFKRIKYFSLVNNEFDKTTTRKIKRFKVKIPDKYYHVY